MVLHRLAVWPNKQSVGEWASRKSEFRAMTPRAKRQVMSKRASKWARWGRGRSHPASSSGWRPLLIEAFFIMNDNKLGWVDPIEVQLPRLLLLLFFFHLRERVREPGMFYFYGVHIIPHSRSSAEALSQATRLQASTGRIRCT